MYGEEFGIKHLELVAFKEHIQDDIIYEYQLIQFKTSKLLYSNDPPA